MGRLDQLGKHGSDKELKLPMACCFGRGDVSRQPLDGPSHAWLVFTENPPPLTLGRSRIVHALRTHPVQEALVDHRMLLREIRLGMLAAVITALGGILSEVGSVMMV